MQIQIYSTLGNLELNLVLFNFFYKCVQLYKIITPIKSAVILVNYL